MGEEDQNLWSSLLSEVQANSSKGLPSSKNLLVLGNNLSGKTTLVAKLQAVEQPKKGNGLEYSYMEIRDDNFEYSTNLGVYVLDGDENHTNLLKYALSSDTVANTTILICASMETPWGIVPQILHWLQVVEEHLASMELPADVKQQLQQLIADRWKQYSEFVDFFDFSPSGDLTASQYKKDLQDRSPDEALAKNLGCDIMIAITKTDSMTNLETDYNYNEEKFDFIQQAVRKVCLEYGASLFYVSVKEEKNCDLLYKYLTHRIFNFSFNTPALVVERDALFIPAGWDSVNKISILFENIRTFYPDQAYSEVIRSPKVMEKKYSPRVEIVTESEQDFLSRIYQYLGDEGNEAEAAPQGVLKTPERRAIGSPGVYSVAAKHRVGQTGLSSSSASGQINVGPATSDGAISNFFHALLNKKSGGSPSMSGTTLRHQLEAARNEAAAAAAIDAEPEKTDAEKKCFDMETSINLGKEANVTGMTILAEESYQKHTRSQTPIE